MRYLDIEIRFKNLESLFDGGARGIKLLDIFCYGNIFACMTRRALTTDVFSAIAEPRRREVIAVLADGEEYAVNEIVVRMRIAQPAVSKHLGALRRAGVVTVVKRGQHRMYRLNAEGLRPVHEWVKVFERYWTHQVDQIKQRAERKALERMIRVDDGTDHSGSDRNNREG